MAPHSSILAGKSHGQRNLAGCSPWGHKESDTTEHLHFSINACYLCLLVWLLLHIILLNSQHSCNKSAKSYHYVHRWEVRLRETKWFPKVIQPNESWVGILFQSWCTQTLKWSEVKSLSHIRLFATPWTAACQAPLSMEFSRQEYWSGLPLPSPGDLPNPGIEPGFPTL